ncbi:NADP-dependent oxidoreductase domain-containing protein [Apodospora peruviana]|uniref:NADP-dependent oxidoreductase domain-containing protein n=1 Tax=Apodospora peruviana TaxID=516989 RepID=A0AAE0M4E1_9PEZI|nr:NADP-dependent oxidoreductase domain-containing protein [Apodospora peruviana]
MAPLQNTISSTTQHRKTYRLNTGTSIPAVGLGTWRTRQPGDVEKAVETALRAGYRHVDTAMAYGNEKQVGDGIRASGVPRTDVWVTTKLDNTWHRRVAEGIDISLTNLGFDYVDLYLMHWPCSTDPEDGSKHLEGWDFVDTWREMQKLVGTGKVRNIGVSNFGVRNLERLLKDPSCRIVPAVNQIELHPCNPSPKLVAFNSSKGIHSSAYSPLGGQTDSPLYINETILSLAEAKHRTTQQIILMWGIQKGWSVLPKSVTKSRIDGNFDLDGWSLADDEVARIDAILDRFKIWQDDWLPEKMFFGDDE